jgi:hypothetical protein
MKPVFAKLKIADCITLCGVIVVGFGWLLIDQWFLNEVYQRFIALFVLLTFLFMAQFKINHPEKVIAYANTLVLICLSFIVVISVVMHVFIKNDFSYKSVLIWILTALLPYLSGGIYLLISKIK